MKEFDIISIGAGSGGIATMNRAESTEHALLSSKKNNWGGTCVNRGCVPKRLCGMVHKLQKPFVITGQIMDLLLNRPDLILQP